MTHGSLQRRMNVGEKQELRVGVLLGNFRLELLENIQFGEIGFRFIQIIGVASAPAKSLAGRALDAARVDAALLEHVFVLRREIIAHDGHHAHFGEETRCQCKMRGRATQNVFHATGRRGDVVECHRTNDEYAHDEV